MEERQRKKLETQEKGLCMQAAENMMMRICRVIDTLGRDTDRVERRERKKWGRRKPDTREDKGR